MMATQEANSPAETTPGIPDAKTLALANILYDVVALLSAAEERIDAMTNGSDEVHSTLRLVQMAHAKVDGILEGC